MDMTQSPVVVSLREQLWQRARRVRFMAFPAIQRGVQHTDVETPGRRRWKIGCEVSRFSAVGKSLSVD
jgi:hypothetical protein